VLSHQPAAEQQFPNDEPRQVVPPFAAPHCPLVETGAVEVGTAEVRVEDGGMTTEDEGGTTTEDDGGTTTDEDPAPVPQVPKSGWQPVPQWTEVLSHQPAEEQQFPKVDPWQVAPPLVAPHVPSVETRVAVEEGAAEVVVPVPAVEV